MKMHTQNDTRSNRNQSRLTSKKGGFHFLASVLFLSIPFFLTSCGKKGSASVNCTKVEQFESNEGVLNLNQHVHGNIVRLDLDKKTGQYIHNIPITSGYTVSEPMDTTIVLTSTGFEVQLAGEIKKANAEVQAEAKSTVTNNTTFLVENSIRKTVKMPLVDLNNDSTLQEIVKDDESPSVAYLVVSGIVYADKFSFQTKKSINVNGQANTFKAGEYTVSVSYNCEGTLQLNAKQGGIFYKATFFKLNADKSKFIPAEVQDLKKFEIFHSIAR